MKPFEERLALESADWVRDGLVSEEQRAALLQRHPAAAGGHSRFIGIVATLGGLLFAVGISLIIKANWTEIGDWTKIGGLVGLLVGFYAAGWRLKEGGRLVKTGDACLMVGGIFFLCGIALVSQIFHLNARPASGLFVWWLGIVTVPWITRAKGAQFLSVAAALIWLGQEMTTPGSWIEVGGVYNRHNDAVVAALFSLLGVALWLSGLALRETRWNTFAGLHEKAGLLVSFGSLYVLGFERHAWAFETGSASALERGTWSAVAMALVLAAAAVVAAMRNARAETRSLLPWLGLSLAPFVAVLAVGSLRDAGSWVSALAWVTLFVLSLGVVRMGLATGREGWVNLGILGIAVNVITRYFDLFGTMLEGGVFFIVTGVLVTGMGIYLERKRRALVSALRMEGRS